MFAVVILLNLYISMTQSVMFVCCGDVLLQQRQLREDSAFC